ncbi:branched-chain amino acid ABC transporter permease [Trinickia dinghuensis]|uniref:Branched-chain amino acid ABC transporter permease n=1 Tax=Trinickia dinghuensis TaxID=2291023 RepID=A0A3D8K1Y0_9BURK|nr:branched-chain amino acid ABC transporter permease [Trinickia dinghuensis]RDU98845.1 branched-chain amino acid ABC transporter permease [Trinickia dinghuensis]
MELLGMPLGAVASQLVLGLMNGCFYAVLSLGLSVIFGLLNVINFTHGAFFMLGALFAWMGTNYFGFGYWPMLIVAPLAVGAVGMVIEQTMLRRIYKLDPLYGLLLTLGLTLIIDGLSRSAYGVSGMSYAGPDSLMRGLDLGFMVLPAYRAWVVVASLVVCAGTRGVIERTNLGALLRAATENPRLVAAFGVNVPRMVSLTYAGGVALAALAGVLAAPVVQVSPLMGQSVIITVFAIVVIGGMGSIAGSVLTSLALGAIESLTKLFYPEASATVVFAVMALVLLVRPAGLFGNSK